MRKSNTPWYCEERCQGALVSWKDYDRPRQYGMLVGHRLVRRPGMPESQSVLMLVLLGPDGHVLMNPYEVTRVEEENPNNIMGLQNS